MGKNKLKKFAEMRELPNVFQCAMRDFTPDEPAAQMRGRWHTYFGNDNPITIELGCGHGDYTTGLAKLHPERNYIGIDIKGARIWHGAKEAHLNGMTNVAFLRTNIEMLPSFFAENEVDEIWITFPDPQMKKATKRLTSSFFMERYCKLLKPNGIIHLKTDSPFLYIYTRAMVNENKFDVIADAEDLYSPDSIGKYEAAQALQTHYERQWLDRGLTIKYLAWHLPQEQPFIEPDIEIEKDTYRSYGRNYVSPTNN